VNTYILLLCIIQGIGEFLPISSSAHLTLLSFLFNQSPTSLEWEVALHLGTLIAVTIYFRQEIQAMIQAALGLIFSKNRSLWWSSSEWQVALSLIIATLPAILVGYLVKDEIKDLSSPTIIGCSSIIFGILLYLADIYQNRRSQKLTLSKAFFIGCAQVLAFIPGASRSGCCITAARYAGLGRVEATSFAFLLSIPTVFAAVTLTGYDIFKQEISLNWGIVFQAVTLTAALGLGTIHGVLIFVKRHSFKPFMIYRIILGIVLLGFSLYKIS
jgi:undecaprenyl-diphosphatase